MVESMTSLFDMDPGVKEPSEKSQISDEIDDLVTDEFVGPAWTLGIENLRLVENDRIVEVSATSQPGGAQRFDFVGEPESPRGSQLALENPLVEAWDLERLSADTGMGKVDRIGNMENLGGFDSDPTIRFANLEGFDHRKRASRSDLSLFSREPNPFDERRSTPVHHRDLRPPDLDSNVVDLERKERGKQVFDRGDLHAFRAFGISRIVDPATPNTACCRRSARRG